MGQVNWMGMLYGRNAFETLKNIPSFPAGTVCLVVASIHRCSFLVLEVLGNMMQGSPVLWQWAMATSCGSGQRSRIGHRRLSSIVAKVPRLPSPPQGYLMLQDFAIYPATKQ